jgi:electron-transferring-flavoprotein dehydrogenase
MANIATMSQPLRRFVVICPRQLQRQQRRALSTATRRYATEAKYDPLTVERASDDVDVCIVGGGPAGLSAAIRLKQLEKERGGEELRVVLLEKGSEIGQLLF